MAIVYCWSYLFKNLGHRRNDDDDNDDDDDDEGDDDGDDDDDDDGIRSLSNGASISHSSPWSQPFPE